MPRKASSQPYFRLTKVVATAPAEISKEDLEFFSDGEHVVETSSGKGVYGTIEEDVSFSIVEDSVHIVGETGSIEEDRLLTQARSICRQFDVDVVPSVRYVGALHPLFTFELFADFVGEDVEYDPAFQEECLYVEYDETKAKIYKSGVVDFDENVSIHEMEAFVQGVNETVHDVLPTAPTFIPDIKTFADGWARPISHDLGDAIRLFHVADERGYSQTGDIDSHLLKQFDLAPCPTSYAGLYEISLALSGVWALSGTNDTAGVQACKKSTHNGLGIEQIEKGRDPDQGVPLKSIFELSPTSAISGMVDYPKRLTTEHSVCKEVLNELAVLQTRLKSVIDYHAHRHGLSDPNLSEGQWRVSNDDEQMVVRPCETVALRKQLLQRGICHDPVPMVEVVNIEGDSVSTETSDDVSVGDAILVDVADVEGSVETAATTDAERARTE